MIGRLGFCDVRGLCEINRREQNFYVFSNRLIPSFFFNLAMISFINEQTLYGTKSLKLKTVLSLASIALSWEE